MRIEEERTEDGLVILRVSVEKLTLKNITLLQGGLREYRREEKRFFILNLKNCSVITDAVVSSLLSFVDYLKRWSNGGDVKFVGLTKKMKKRIKKLHPECPIDSFDTEKKAVSSFRIEFLTL